MKKYNPVVEYVFPGSIAEEYEIQSGEKLRSLNGTVLRDIIDYQYLSAESELEAEIEDRDGNIRIVKIEKDEDDDLGIGMAAQVFVIVLAASGDDHHFGTHILQNGLCGDGGAAGTQNQRFLIPNFDATAQHHGVEAVVIGVVAVDFPISADDVIDRTQPLGDGVYLIQKRDHILLVGDGDIHGIVIPMEDEFSHFLGLFFKQVIGVRPHHGMDLGGVTVPQMLAQQSAAHHTTSV